MKRTYRPPLAKPTEVEFEQSLLVATARFVLEVDPDQNMNTTTGSDTEGGEMYFEF